MACYSHQDVIDRVGVILYFRNTNISFDTYP
jgi:hypothetical protein